MSIQIRLPLAPASAATKAVASISAPVSLPLEPAGRAFTQALIGDRVVIKRSTSADSLQSINFHDPKWEKLRAADIEHDDYYGLLDLTKENVDATEEDIKKAYRIISIVCHPDKASNERRAEAQERYKALQIGYETLTDLPRRRAYDSTLSFSDAIPKDKEGLTEKTFFSAYGPVFERNERFSMVKPCPKLGDMSSSNADVHAFYDFWYSFKSWRDFSALNEHRLETANSREEKRMFIRENEKKQAGAKKDELARVRKLVDDAAKKDPRLARIKKEEEEEKKKRKNAKFNVAKEREEEEKRKKAEAEAAAVAEKERVIQAAKAEKEYKQAIKSARSYFGKYCREAGLPEADIDTLKTKLNLDQYNEIVNMFKADAKSEEAKKLFNSHLTASSDDDAASKAAAAEAKAKAAYEAKKAEEVKAAADNTPWSFEEDQLLVKAVIKFPGGAQQRWEKIAEMINTHSGRGLNRSTKEVIRRQKEMETSLGAVSVSVEEAYAKYMLRLKGDAHANEAAKVRNMTREQVLAMLAEDENKEKARVAAAIEAEKKDKAAAEKERVIQAAQAEKDMIAKEKARAAEERAKEEAKKKKKEADKAAKRAKGSSPTPAAAAPVKAAATEAEEPWTADEQAALEGGLKSVSKDAADRWEQIAALVGTKNKKQCVARFKTIRDQVKAQA